MGLIHSGARGAKILGWVTLCLKSSKADLGEDLNASSLLERRHQEEPIGECYLRQGRGKKKHTKKQSNNLIK